ncbi:hypothetical protein LTR37_002436 [Vermiconidia calcicola]|uniref:Uncharacterized protein n=1 Tax=Vermiconidia calcicola TaxID=1690605 RepID=A0ACC3NSY2_9PEZI|nr:hypothetical protein LTR37_002436 [Vermiconidia calcicola]
MSGHVNGVNGEEVVPLPSAKPFNVSSTVTIQAPLTRRGYGPGLVLVVPSDLDLQGSDKTLDPPPLQKWAEEGFAVAQIKVADGESSKFGSYLQDATSGLQELSECDSTDKLGLIAYNAPVTQDVARAIEFEEHIVAVINYGTSKIQCSKPQLIHITGAAPELMDDDSVKKFVYLGLGSHFTIPAHHNFSNAPAGVAHTRCLTFLKPLTGGPYFDLEAIWDEHTKFEFGERAVEKTMGTMVQEPYVNHIPTMAGGIGRERLTNFYRHHFISNNPDDTALQLVSRTVGIDRVIDEFIFTFTHDRQIDWLLPGVPPTGKYCELPFTSVVNIRGDRLFHEHIGWDQATALRQLGLMPEYLPFPYDLPDGRRPAAGKRFEYKVPTAGAEISKKLVDERSAESNRMFEFSVREVIE